MTLERQREIDEIFTALEYSCFDELDECNFYNCIVESFKERYKKAFSYDSGVTKGVLIFKSLGFVIKIPFSSHDDCELCGADCSNGWDYCEAEANKYKMACDYGVEECFAQTIKIGELDGYPIYMQEYAQILGCDESNSSHTEADEEAIEHLCEKENYDCFNRFWLSDVFNIYGESKFYKIMNFIEDADIRDLHNGNIGYVGMRPVFIDYSSWND